VCSVAQSFRNAKEPEVYVVPFAARHSISTPLLLVGMEVDVVDEGDCVLLVDVVRVVGAAVWIVEVRVLAAAASALVCDSELFQSQKLERSKGRSVTVR
jgi:hypothetical protein